MKTLKNLTWQDNWSTYIQFGVLEIPEWVNTVVQEDGLRHYRPKMPDAHTGGILNLMHEFHDGDYSYTVYEAYLKAVEIKAASYTENCLGGVLKRLVKLKKQEIKNIKKGIFDEELKDYINALEKGYKEWIVHPYKPFDGKE